MGRAVAVKMLRMDGELDERAVLRFEREARLLATIQHPHVVSLLDFGQCQGRLYLVMELLEGESLADLIQYEAPLPLRRIKVIMTQLLEALRSAHGKRVLHRDLKPSNVFLTSYGADADHLKLIDFGIARDLGPDGDEQSLTRTGALVGSPGYVAPEQTTREPVSVRSDLYAVGLIGYELLTGARPRSSLVADVEPPSVDGRRLEGTVVDVVMSCLERDPQGRPSSAAAALEALQLERLLGGDADPQETSTRNISSAPAAFTRRRTPRWFTGAVIVSMLVTGLVAWRFITKRSPSQSISPPAAPSEVRTSPATPIAGQVESTKKSDEATETTSEEESKPTSDKEDAVGSDPEPSPVPTKTLRWTRLESRPAGARVLLGTKLLGTTPLRVPWSGKAPPERLRIIQAGYHELDVSLSVEDDRTTQVLQLSRLPRIKKRRSSHTAQPKPVLVR